MAKIITRFLFGEVQLPASYTHIVAFLTGLAAGAVGISALYNYLNRNKRNHAKVQLAVFHVVRFMKAHPSYEALLQRPHDLLKLMEPEVMLMLDQHLTKIEAGEVFKELKRKYDVEDVEEVIRKRVREEKRSEGKKLVAPFFMPAYAPSPRGFLPPDPKFYSPAACYRRAYPRACSEAYQGVLSMGCPVCSSSQLLTCSLRHTRTG